MADKKGKVLDVDAYLNDLAVTIKIKGKAFVVKDVPMKIRDLFSSSDEAKQREGLMLLLGCQKEDLDGYGYAATSAIISHIIENLFPPSSQKNQSGD